MLLNIKYAYKKGALRIDIYAEKRTRNIIRRGVGKCRSFSDQQTAFNVRGVAPSEMNKIVTLLKAVSTRSVGKTVIRTNNTCTVDRMLL